MFALFVCYACFVAGWFAALTAVAWVRIHQDERSASYQPAGSVSSPTLPPGAE